VDYKQTYKKVDCSTILKAKIIIILVPCQETSHHRGMSTMNHWLNVVVFWLMLAHRSTF